MSVIPSEARDLWGGGRRASWILRASLHTTDPSLRSG